MAQWTQSSDAARPCSRTYAERVREELAGLMHIPVVMMGYGLDDDGFHGANEHLSIEMFHRGVETAIVYLEELARLPQGVGAAAAARV